MKNRLIIISALLLSSLIPAVAQSSIVVEATMDSTVLWMGEQTLIHLSMTQDEDMQVLYPAVEAPGELVKGVEVLDISDPDTAVLANNRLNIKQEVLVTSFDSGFYYIPPFKYVFDEDTFATQSLSLKIVPVNIEPDATADNAKDIKDVADPPFVLWDFIPAWVLWLILAIVLITLATMYVIRYLRNRKVAEVVAPEVKIPPYELAMQALNELRDSKLWQQGQEKSYYTRLVDILREYIDSRFGINAMEMTSTEIMASLRGNKELKEVNKYMNEILSMADFVKFAKMRPLPDDNERVMRYAFDFVELTRPQPQPADSEDGDAKKQVTQ